MTRKTTKLTVEFNDDLAEALEELARSQGVSKAAVLRRSLALMRFFDDAQKRGERPAVTDSEGNVKREILLT